MIRRIKLSGRRWTFDDTERIRGKWGECVYDGRRIRVSPAAAEAGRRREIAIHEMLHALFPWMAEEVVDSAAVDLHKALNAIGE